MNETDERKIPTLMVILLKAAVLVLIVLCIFFIAYPHACVNLIEGRQTEEQSIQDINKPLIQANQDVTQTPQPAQQQQTVTVTQPQTTVTTTTQPAGQQTVTIMTPAAPQQVQQLPKAAAQTVNQTVQTATQTVQTQVGQTTQTVQAQAGQAAQAAQQTTTTALDAAIKEQQELQAQQDVYDYNVIKRYVAVEKDYLKTHPNDNAAATAITQQVMNEYQLNDQEWREIIAKANDRGWFDALRGK